MRNFKRQAELVKKLSKPQYSKVALLLMLVALITSCATTHSFKASTDKPLNRIWNDLNFATRSHVGLSIYDTQKDQWIFNYKTDNYFTPASNTKILTMYAALQILGEHLDAALYTTRADSLIIWGGGDPGTLYPNIDTTSPMIDFIKASNKKIVFSTTHFLSQRYGKGWAWDDYPFVYQCERNAFPIYGNRMWIERKDDTIAIKPVYLIPLVIITSDTITKAGKSEWGDRYFYTYNPAQREDHQEIPITFFKNDIQNSWSTVTGKNIFFLDIPLSSDALSIEGSNRDSLIKIMMQESDNFVAEQLLLACSLKEFNYMSDETMIDSMMKGQLRDIQDELKWVDGSGLSRYNQMTPHSLVYILQKIIDLKGLDYIKAVFPAGGQSGTLTNWYTGKNDKPYVFAKTGSLQGTQCLSGFLVTKTGNVLIFSWMNNQFPGDADDLKASMEKLLSYLYKHY